MFANFISMTIQGPPATTSTIPTKGNGTVKPNEMSIRFTPEKGVLGKSLVVLCNSNGIPKPAYTIFHNGSVVSFEMAYSVSEVKLNDAGTYECLAKNTLGNVTASSFLTVSDQSCYNCNGSSGTKWHIIVVTLVSGIIIGVIISYIVSCSRLKFRNRKPQNTNPEPATSEVNTNYQELDLRKINTEDNYQSLAKNDGAKNDDSTYTQLSSTRDQENNYQSLT
ncbi:uncharacterized protein LOC114522762 [Dendronephthya gigantea]|uniref:uncharacterized protein LOC114522762 n=1 Tax=Dendronephthya gigantea TaxID=151771 RepID=UPI00106CB4FF|nr:uncharacterized protein LOC114522762 [Dendronephthya gigantea]